MTCKPFYLQGFLRGMKTLLAIYISTPCHINVSFRKFTFKLCVIYEEPVGILERITNIEHCINISPLLVPYVRTNGAMKKKCNFIRCYEMTRFILKRENVNGF
jgi:hypothetical protein